MTPLVLLGTAVPVWLFFVGWSLVFPLVLPLWLYQVLYAGFWLWATAVPQSACRRSNRPFVCLQGDYADHAFFNDTGSVFLTWFVSWP